MRTKSGTQHSYYMMRDRCRNPSSDKWKWYGARGIKVCERWDTFENFLADMGPRPPGCTLDRKDVNGNYDPTNCRWATAMEQGANKRNNRVVVVDGSAVHLSDAARKSGISVGTLWRRLQLGWSDQEATQTPLSQVRDTRKTRTYTERRQDNTTR